MCVTTVTEPFCSHERVGITWDTGREIHFGAVRPETDRLGQNQAATKSPFP
uniref:Uncharacterized protein n=1 Tax=Anguilla anguilla TaxID=7936 RepID=A0A0E9QIH0_ANGAN